jgi:hypothetical protein
MALTSVEVARFSLGAGAQLQNGASDYHSEA